MSRIEFCIRALREGPSRRHQPADQEHDQAHQDDVPQRERAALGVRDAGRGRSTTGAIFTCRTLVVAVASLAPARGTRTARRRQLLRQLSNLALRSLQLPRLRVLAAPSHHHRVRAIVQKGNGTQHHPPRRPEHASCPRRAIWCSSAAPGTSPASLSSPTQAPPWLACPAS